MPNQAEIPHRQQFLSQLSANRLPDNEGGLPATSHLATYARGLLKLHDLAEFYVINGQQPFSWKEPQGIDRKPVEVPVTDKAMMLMAKSMRGIKEDLVTVGLSSRVKTVEEEVHKVLQHEAEVHGQADDEYIKIVMGMAQEQTPAARLAQSKTAFMDQLKAFEGEVAAQDASMAGKLTAFAEHIFQVSDFEREHRGANSKFVKHAREREFTMWEELSRLGYGEHASAIVRKIKALYNPQSSPVQK